MDSNFTLSPEPTGPHARFSGRYQYASLAGKSRTIRLLKICDGKDYTLEGQDDTERNQCKQDCCQEIDSNTPRLELHEIDLDTAPAYEAISYAWGSAAVMQKVVCHSGVLQVTQSCFNLLRTLRTRDQFSPLNKFSRRHETDISKYSNKIGFYWIDAICIDQCSLQERSQQVAIMAAIYQKADQVVVWPEYHGTTWIMKAVLECGFQFGIKLINITLRLIADHIDSVSEEEACQLRGLIERPYFTRMWPLQEIALARSCCILISATEELDIRCVLLLPYEGWEYKEDSPLRSLDAAVRSQYERATFLHRQLLTVFQSHSHDSKIATRLSLHRQLLTFTQLHPNGWTHAEQSSLVFQLTGARQPEAPKVVEQRSVSHLVSTTLLSARSLQATEPRDKVFALYGLLEQLKAPFTAPDYSKSIEEVYVDTTEAAMSIDRSLRILGGLTGNSNFNLPSWSPDWSDHQHVTEVAEWQYYEAAGQSECQIDIERRELSVSGSVIDLVHQEHLIFPSASFLYEGNNLTETLLNSFDSPGSIPVHQHEALLERLSLDIWMPFEKLGFDAFQYGMLITGFLVGMKNKITGQKNRRWSVYKMMNCTRNNPGLKRVPHEHWPILHAGLCRRLDRKKLFQTRHGRLGIASPEAEIGDSIILLQGCNLPMVARPNGDKWRLIAPAYIPQDGIMEETYGKQLPCVNLYFYKPIRLLLINKTFRKAAKP